MPIGAHRNVEVCLVGEHNFYWVPIAHTILPSFTLPPTSPADKKRRETQKQ
jgi:hypothetical protein